MTETEFNIIKMIVDEDIKKNNREDLLKVKEYIEKKIDDADRYYLLPASHAAIVISKSEFEKNKSKKI